MLKDGSNVELELGAHFKRTQTAPGAEKLSPEARVAAVDEAIANSIQGDAISSSLADLKATRSTMMTTKTAEFASWRAQALAQVCEGLYVSCQSKKQGNSLVCLCFCLCITLH